MNCDNQYCKYRNEARKNGCYWETEKENCHYEKEKQMFDVSKYIRENRDDEEKRREYPLCKRVECADGFTISIQANSAAYCSPRDNDGEWYQVECGFPSAPVPELAEWKEGEGDDTKTVYGYVPVEVVSELIEKHGGEK